MRSTFAICTLVFLAACGKESSEASLTQSAATDAPQPAAVVPAPPPAAAPAAPSLETIASTLGRTPDACARDAGQEVARSTVSKTAKGRIDKVQVRSCGKVIPMYEAIPAGATAKTPTVIALHQTADVGKDEVMGLRGSPDLAFGRTFFERGFVVVAPDAFIAGENFDPQTGWDTAPFYREFPEWSAMGRMLQDDLAVLQYVERKRPGCTAVVGHSLGGHNALLLAAFDERIDAVVASGGFESMAGDKDAARWARPSLFVYMPLLKPYVNQPAPRQVPWDWDHVLSLIAPRPTLVVQGAKDPMWTHPESAAAVVAKVKEDHPSAPLEGIFHPGGHEFGQDLQVRAAEFVKAACT